MDIAIVTGAHSGVGLEIARKLVQMGYRVYALAADFKHCTFNHKDFKKFPIDFSEATGLEKVMDELFKQKGPVGVLVHALEPVEGMALEPAFRAHLLSALALTQAFLPQLKEYQGYCIHLVWKNGLNPMQSALAAGCEAYFSSLFEQHRDEGLRVSAVIIEKNSTQGLGANAYNDPQSCINPKTVAEAVEKIVRYRDGNIISQITIRPQATEEEPRLARSPGPSGDYKAIQLPSAENFPAEPKLIPTPARQHRHPVKRPQSRLQTRQESRPQTRPQKKAYASSSARKPLPEPKAKPPVVQEVTPQASVKKKRPRQLFQKKRPLENSSKSEG